MITMRTWSLTKDVLPEVNEKSKPHNNSPRELFYCIYRAVYDTVFIISYCILFRTVHLTLLYEHQLMEMSLVVFCI